MFQRSFAARSETLAHHQPKAPSMWGFRRRAAADAVVTPAPAEDSFAADSYAESFESFGRSGLQLGGLHRDQQWVGAWGGRC